MAQVEKITIFKKGAKAIQGRTAENPKTEGQIFSQVKEMRQAEKPVKNGGFLGEQSKF